jgi:hypothetical protein
MTINVKRCLVWCFSAERFTKVLSLMRRSQYAKDPEYVLMRALDLQRHLGTEFTVGLYICSHLTDAELDLLTLLVRCHDWSWRQKTPQWRYQRAAQQRTAIGRRFRRTWKDSAELDAIKKLRKLEAERLKKWWHDLQPRLEGYTEQVLAVS